MAGKAALFQAGLALIFVLFFFSNDLCIFGCAGSSGCVGFSRAAVSRASSPVVALGLLTAEAPLVAEQAPVVAGHELGSRSSQALKHGLSSCG